MVKKLYIICVKIDDTLPWIELKGEYQTKKAAKKAAEEFLKSAKIKVARIPESRERLKAILTARAT